jgi:dynein light intermediate chain 1
MLRPPDILARLSIYTLQEPVPAFSPLVKTLLTPQTVPASLVVILLDWSEPWNWIRQLRDWILFVENLITSVDTATAETINQNAQHSSSQGAPPAREEGAGHADGSTTPVLQGPGEYDEALGLPICVVCHNVGMSLRHWHLLIYTSQTRSRPWRRTTAGEKRSSTTCSSSCGLSFSNVLACNFDTTFCLRYPDGASLIYTSNTSPNSLPLLVQSSLEVHSSLKRETLKHNVVDRESILIPPNWDSWGKIRVIREGFDVEAISHAWSEAIQASATARNAKMRHPNENGTEHEAPTPGPLANESDWNKVLQAFSEAFQDPAPPSTNLNATTGDEAQVKAPNMHEYLAKQAQVIEQLRQEDEKMQTAGGDSRARTNGVDEDADSVNRVNEHIGPVKFNMGGIQVDAEDMLNSLRNKDREETPGPEAEPAASTPAGTATPDGGKQQNEALASFFAGLIKKGGTPKPGGK